MIGNGSTPVSAMRPAKTDMIAGTLGERACMVGATLGSGRIAVTFNLIPSDASFFIRSNADCFLVFMIGIFTYTFDAHELMMRAWRSISTNSSEKTSKETGLIFSRRGPLLQNWRSRQRQPFS